MKLNIWKGNARSAAGHNPGELLLHFSLELINCRVSFPAKTVEINKRGDNIVRAAVVSYFLGKLGDIHATLQIVLCRVNTFVEEMFG